MYVDTREGPAFAIVPGDVAGALEEAAPDPEALERAVELAALLLVRLGAEAGTLLLRQWMEFDPGLLIRADPRIADTLANEPERLTGTLAG